WVFFAIAAAHYCWTHRVTSHAEELHARFAPLDGRHLVGPFILMYGGAVDHHRAAFDALLGHFDEAVNRLDTAFEAYAQLKSPLYTALALEVLAVAFAGRGRRGDGPRAVAAARKAWALSREVGNVALHERLKTMI